MGTVNSSGNITKVCDGHVTVELLLRVNGVCPEAVEIDCSAGDSCGIWDADPVAIGVFVFVIVVVATGVDHADYERRGLWAWGLVPLNQCNGLTVFALILRNLV